MYQKVADEDFAEWAFGREAWVDFVSWETGPLDLLDAWNDRHSNIYRLETDYPLEESLRIIEELYQQQRISPMDKKMHKVTESMKSAVKNIDKGKPKEAAKVLKGAEKKNEKLVKIDRDVRDPLIEKCEKSMPMKKGKK